MKLLLFSDNHRDKESVKNLVSLYPDIIHIVSLGDSEMREHELTQLNIYGVRGNSLFDPKFPANLTLFYNGVKTLITHGHHYSVKLGLSRLLNYATYNEIQMVCYGHTHKASIKDINDIIFINPGALSKRGNFKSPTYAIVDITKKEIDIAIKSLNGDIIQHYKKNR